MSPPPEGEVAGVLLPPHFVSAPPGEAGGGSPTRGAVGSVLLLPPEGEVGVFYLPPEAGGGVFSFVSPLLFCLTPGVGFPSFEARRQGMCYLPSERSAVLLPCLEAGGGRVLC